MDVPTIKNRLRSARRVRMNENGETFSLSLRPGASYRLSLIVPPVTLFMMLAAVLSGLDYESKIGIILFSLILLGAAIANVVNQKAERILVADSGGVRLSKGGKIVREIPWQQVRLVHYGSITVYKGSKAAKVPLLQVFGKGPRPVINILETGYRVPRGSVQNAAEAISRLAQINNVKVVQKDGYGH